MIHEEGKMMLEEQLDISTHNNSNGRKKQEHKEY